MTGNLTQTELYENGKAEGTYISREWQPTLIFLPGKSYGHSSQVGYSPWDHKESDVTE